MAVTIVKCEYDENWDRAASYDLGVGSYTVNWLVVVEEDNLHGSQVLREAFEGTLPEGSDELPTQGQPFQWDDFEEETYPVKVSIKLKDNKDPKTWVIEVEFKAPDSGDGKSKRDREKFTKPNPLDWAPDYWVEYVEEQVPVEYASLLSGGRFFFEDPEDEDAEQLGESLWYLPITTTFPNIRRGIGFESGVEEPGPIVNAAGQQTIDPITEAAFRTILIAARNYATAFESIQMNREFMETVNSEEFLGDPPRTWRFMMAYTERPQEKSLRDQDNTDYPDEIITFFPTTVKLEFNPKTWDRFVLNNGQSSFRCIDGNPADLITDPRFIGAGEFPMLFAARVMELTEAAAASTDEPVVADLVPVTASEPVNLDLNGLCVHEIDPGHESFAKTYHLQYRHYREVDFNLIPAFAELVAEYAEFVGA